MPLANFSKLSKKLNLNPAVCHKTFQLHKFLIVEGIFMKIYTNIKHHQLQCKFKNRNSVIIFNGPIGSLVILHLKVVSVP